MMKESTVSIEKGGNMSKECSVCTSEDLGAIEGALEAGVSLRGVAERFGTSKSSLQRHRDHIRVAGGAAVEEKPDEPLPQEEPAKVAEDPAQPPQHIVSVEEKPHKEPLSPAEQAWNNFVDELERLEAEARQQKPRLKEAISRLNDEVWAARQKITPLEAQEVELTAKLSGIQAEALARVERGQAGDSSGDLARVAEELTSVRQALAIEKVGFEELARQVKERTGGLQARIWGLEKALADFMGKTWKQWWWELEKAEKEVKSQEEDLKEQARGSAGSSGAIRWLADKIENLEQELARAMAERDLLRYLVGRLGKLLKKELLYREALIHARVLPFDWTWPPLIERRIPNPHYQGIVWGGRYDEIVMEKDPRWTTS